MWTALAGWFLGPVNQRIHTVTSVCFVFNPNTLYFKIVGHQFYFIPLEFEIMGFDNIGTITSITSLQLQLLNVSWLLNSFETTIYMYLQDI